MNPRVIHCSKVLLHDGWSENVRLILDRQGVVIRLESGPACEGDLRLRGVVLPGMPNAHSHGFQRAIAGLTGNQAAAGDSFWSWREAMYRVAQRVNPDQMHQLMAGVYMEMLKAGYTSCAEFHYLHHANGGVPYENRAEMSLRVLAGAGLAGMPVTLLPVLYGRSGFAATEVEDHQQRFFHRADDFVGLVEAIRKAVGENPLLHLGLAPHSLRAVSEMDLHLILEARREGEPVHIHIAEQPAEVEECLQVTGRRPLALLQELFTLDAGWCLVHATHINDSELSAAAQSGAVAVICPSTEADLGDGVFRAQEWMGRGGVVAIGSDSNLRLNVTEELRWLEFGQRLVLGNRNVLNQAHRGCGRSLYQQSARGGGQALGQPVGAIAPGMRADLVELDINHPLLNGLREDDLLDTHVFAGLPAMLKSVWVAGHNLVDRGVHMAEEQIMPGYAAALSQLRS